ncbi:VOC family protein [Histidinibacterium aquaticum]|uniref:VOC family protein n=1 Tax=Histidinibacterium aquaticum TaxID=2613962 RepID=A0A5J5GQN8_9RHOB|nr:VOC family protein [Histidinibacterium aquaticum]KAA9010500.1 VOC family protein [Histidinibacterium aquaticum]
MPVSRPIVVWTEIPVTDLKAACDFYSTVFGWTMTIDESGPNPMAVFDGANDTTGGHLYPGTPGQGPTIHFAVPDTVEAAADRVAEAGGKVEGPIIPIPVGRFQYALDLDGNSIGLFQPGSA